MKKRLISLFVTGLLLFAVVAFADKTLPVYKKGDSVYVCTCGDSCDCKTMANKEGKCGCGNALGKGVVSSVSKDKVAVKVDGNNLNFPAKAKYACACGDGCICGTVSQKPGKCGCGTEMKKVL
ncbi:MAG: hypothetical protein WCI45_08115 [Desulfuromonadales bacterium]